ncbi:Regulator_of chromosome condensation 1/beta-lactamase-inhibitor protein II [Hexamita inflata]|uniref:Regulator of chromosome condensation 1/beta-lactamase-inhibitor protein II n=1 Tax=Hexamita inflata TaxID=28002 RepID=A0AA86RGE1_9EUKA|nr:Regulator of chromosome condensation 1/beta-lactamase-inhibitor protein II [Hexamita inflata]
MSLVLPDNLVLNTCKIFCYNDYDLWFVTQSGLLYHQETSLFQYTAFARYTLDKLPHNGIVQIAGTSNLMFVLTDNQILVRAGSTTNANNAKNLFCNQVPSNLPHDYVQLQFNHNIKDIDYIDPSRNHDYLFIHMKNGDVYARGANTRGIIASVDNQCERLIGSNISSIQIGRNLTMKKECMYFKANNSIYMYSDKNAVLVKSGVSDYFIRNADYKYQDIFQVTQNALQEFSENVIMFRSGTDYYCSKVQNDSYCLSMQTCSEADNSTYCQIQKCVESNCPETNCTGIQQDNISCQAIVCINAGKTFKYTPECQNRIINYTYITNLTNAEQYKLKSNQFLIKDTANEAEIVQNKMNNCVIVGICCACCVTIYSAITGIVMYFYTKGLRKRYQLAEIQQPLDKSKLSLQNQNLSYTGGME